MADINDWNVSANSNNFPVPNGWPEGQNPSSVNDCAREGMAVVARWNKDINGSVAVAGTDTYTATINATTGFTLYDGYMFCGTFTNANTGAATLNLTVVATPLGAKAIIAPDGSALTGGEIPAGAKVSFKYDGTSFRMDSITHSTATTTKEGIAELATQAEVDAGTETNKIVTPETLAAYSGFSADPVGVVKWFASTTIPTDYLECNGSAISRTTFSVLFAEIGTVFGVGDGSTTFNIPDLRGEFIRGFDNGRGVDVARVFGSSQTDELKSHTHTQQVANSVGGANGTTYSAKVASPEFDSYETKAFGGSETRPRNIALTPIIKVL